jgi:arabinogalactan endo-1,4-beta-galactosidase
MENGGGRWMESHFYEDLDAKKVIFKVDMTGQDVSSGVFITGSWTGESWEILPMANEGNGIYSYFCYLPPGDSGAYYFLNDTVWEARELVPQECAAWWDSDRGYKVGQNDTIYFFKWNTCENGGETAIDIRKQTTKDIDDLNIIVYPVPGIDYIHLDFSSLAEEVSLELVDLSGRVVRKFSNYYYVREVVLDVTNVPQGIYILKVFFNDNIFYRKVILH